MPISATGNSARFPRGDRGFESLRRSAENGFTLLELLVALTILGLMSAVVVLAIPDPRGRLVDEAERFAARAVAARDEAIVSARATRLTVDAGGYRFAQRHHGEWQQLGERPLAGARWTSGTSGSAAEIEFDPAGLADPETRITLQRGDERIAVAIGADGTVHVGK